MAVQQQARSLHTHTALAGALRELLRQLEQHLALRQPMNVYLAGGMAVHLYTGSRVTCDVDAEFGARVHIPSDLAVEVALENGVRQIVYIDTNYSPTFALMHEDYTEDAVATDLGGENIRVYVLAPVDLAVSKIARLADNDRDDIAALVQLGLVSASEIERRATDALVCYVGNLSMLELNVRDAVALARAVEQEQETAPIPTIHAFDAQTSASSYIWQRDDWTNWRYDFDQLREPLANVERLRQVLLADLAKIGVHQQSLLALEAVTNEVRQSGAIEGVSLDVHSVRSSVAKRLGVDIGGLERLRHDVDAVVEMVMDATARCHEPLTEERLYGWHAALFPTGFSGIEPVSIGDWRPGDMHVVSGAYGHQRVHYEAPPADRLPDEMERFLRWINAPSEDHHPVLRAGIAHLWFVTIHPFDDGNGRVARAIGDMMLARADGGGQRYYSFSAQVQRDRANYYKILESTQKGSMDITAWLGWFVNSLEKSILQAQETLNKTLQHAQCWQNWERFGINERQRTVLRRMLEDFRGYMRPQKWAKLAKCTTTDAEEDISHLVRGGIFRVAPGCGKKPGYEIVFPEPSQQLTSDVDVRDDVEDAPDDVSPPKTVARPRPRPAPRLRGPGGW